MATTTVTPEVQVPSQAPQAEQTVVHHNIFDTALLMVITRGWIPMTKTIKGSVIQSTADPRMVSSNKKLFDCPELRAIIRNEEKFDEYLKWKGTPFPLKKGHHLIPVDLYHQVENKLREHKEIRARLVEEFLTVYERAVEDAKKLLGDQFNQNDYLPASRIRDMFRFRAEYLQFTVSDKLRELDKAVHERQQEEWQTTITQAGQAADQLLTAQFKMLLDHLNDKLAPTGETNEDGSEKKKKLHDTMLDRITDFISTLPARNLTNNEHLKAFANQAQALLHDVTTAKIKENDGLKKSLATGFATLKGTLDKFVVEQGTRSITFED